MVHGAWTNEAVMSLTLIGTALTSQIVNVLHFEAPGAIDATLTDDELAIGWASARADHWIANAKTEWLACHPADYRLDMIKAQVLERKSYVDRKLTATEKPQTTANVGTLANPAEHPGSSVVMRWRTPIAGKRHRGRTYIGPIPQQYMNDGYLDTAFRTSYNAFGTKMITTYSGVSGNTNGALLTVYSRPTNEGEGGYPSHKGGTYHIEFFKDYDGNSTNVIAASLDPVLRSQRRRNIGVGA